MANIEFSYLYRDVGNNKKFNSVVFANPDSMNLDELELLIRSKLIEGIWISTAKWLLPDLHFDDRNDELDHDWHEFESVTHTSKSADFSVSLCEWIDAISMC